MSQPPDRTPKALTVSQLTAQIRRLLEDRWPEVHVTGEITNFMRASSGHCYFSLKDEGAMVSAVMWKAAASRLAAQPKDGDHVEIRGALGVYEKRGQYQILVEVLRPVGEGLLWQKFLQLKARLQQEGLFDEARKRPLPTLPARVGIITSPTGAAVRDMISILKRRCPGLEILLWPAPVQGTGAGAQLARAVTTFTRSGLVEVLIIGRGGGSLEDLWEFNDESLARAIFDSPIPVISAVGHETDFSISDFVADLRAPTPSAAAELVSRDHAAVIESVRDLRQRLQRQVDSRLQLLHQRVDRFVGSYALRRPIEQLRECQQRLDDALRSMESTVDRRFKVLESRVAVATGRLAGHDPTLILRKGYAIVRRASNDRVVMSSQKVRPGEHLVTRFQDGTVRSVVATDTPDLFEGGMGEGGVES